MGRLTLHQNEPMTQAERDARYYARNKKAINARRRTQRKLAKNKFNGGTNGKHHWLTPPDIYAKLDAEFQFTPGFDPCPYPLPEGFDGLTCEWPASTYVNPPFGTIFDPKGRKVGGTAWVRKAITEANKGKTVVMVFPVDGWLLMLLAAGAQFRDLGRVRFLATEDRSPQHPKSGRQLAAIILENPQPSNSMLPP